MKSWLQSKFWQKLMFLIGMGMTLFACLEPFNATVGDDSDSLLVVDALISNEYTNYQVRLSRSVANINEEVVAESGATVSVEDDLGATYNFTETEDGVYESNAALFQGVPGRTYTLYIKTADRNVYQSEPCIMPASSAIDSIYYVPGNNPDSVSESSVTGLRMFVNGHADEEETEYLRWSYEEDWKFAVAFGFNEVPTPNGGWVVVDSKKYCWKSDVSNQIMLLAFNSQDQKIVQDKELYFIDSENTDKLTQRYSVQVKQYSISKEEYEFWNKLEESNTNVGNIFGEQPFTIRGNISNVDNSNEHVLGYFSVAGCATKRLYINNAEVRPLRLPFKDYYGSCSVDSLMLDDLGMSAYEIYESYIIEDNYGLNVDLAYSIMDSNNPLSTEVIGLAVSTPQCCDCSLAGDIDAPDFWEDY